MSRVIENPKQLILSKAKEILYTDGYEKLSMRNVAKACNIALGTIYNYYPTKQELVVEMMTEYWNEYMYAAKTTANSDSQFYEKLEKIFEELRNFIKSFKDVWLKPELYANPEYIKQGVEREDLYIEKLIRLVEHILINHEKIKNNLNTYETAKFIVMNFITIIQMPVFKYQDFEIILRILID